MHIITSLYTPRHSNILGLTNKESDNYPRTQVSVTIEIFVSHNRHSYDNDQILTKNWLKTETKICNYKKTWDTSMRFY